MRADSPHVPLTPEEIIVDVELYPTLVEKATALGFSLIRNHPFIDGNKRRGHAALEVFLVLNGQQLNASNQPLAFRGAHPTAERPRGPSWDMVKVAAYPPARSQVMFGVHG